MIDQSLDFYSYLLVVIISLVPERGNIVIPWFLGNDKGEVCTLKGQDQCPAICILVAASQKSRV